jgi:hypothetical protein
VVSDNLYWLEPNDDFTGLARIAPAKVSVKVRPGGPGGPVRVTVANPDSVPALLVRLRLIDAPSGVEALPAYWTDNYLNLLPGESAEVSVTPEADGMPPHPAVEVSGLNVERALEALKPR